MLKELRKVLKNSKSKKKFFHRLRFFFSEGTDPYIMIERAITDAFENFQPPIPGDKKAKKAYKEHVMGAVLIVLDYLKILERRDLNIKGYKICVATAVHGTIVNGGGEYSYQQLVRDYGVEIAHIVDYTSVPPVSDFGGSKNAAKNRFKGRLLQDNVDIAVIVVLLSDLLHNHVVKWPRSRGSVKGKIYETWNFYYPLAISWGILVYELKSATKLLAEDYTSCD